MVNLVNRSGLNVLFIILLCSAKLSGQDSLKYLLFKSHDDRQPILDRYAGQLQVPDSITAIKEILLTKSTLQEEGYLTASVDSISQTPKSIVAHLFVGNRYKWGRVRVSGIPPTWRKQATWKNRNQPIDGQYYRGSFSKLLKQANNNGFPFASTELDSLEIIDQRIHGSLSFESGPLIKFDTIDVNGNQARKKYLTDYLRTAVGSPYSERKVQQIPEYFENLPYYNLNGPVQLLFHNDEARIGIEVERIKSNRFDGIIGFLPNSARDGKTLITGELNLELLNPFESGKEFKIHWQRLKEESQLLDVGVRLPNFIGTPIDVIAEYKQLKEDTTFINRDAKFGGEVSLSPRSAFNLFVDFKSAGLLSSQQSLTSDNLPENIDFRLAKYGWGYSYNSLSVKDLRDDGIRLLSEISIGNRKIRRNANLADSFYESLDTTTPFYQVEVDLTYQKRLNKSVSFYHRIRSGHQFNKNLFKNDLFRVGGLNSLRGFNENQFFGSNYILSNTEMRMYFESNSFLFLFSDQAFIVTKFGGETADNLPIGFGLGFQMTTKSGDFKFAYALGSAEDQPLNFNQSKIHFGIINRF